MMVTVQITYRHGLVKEFVVDGEMLLHEFCRRVKSRGEVRSMRGFKDATAHDLSRSIHLANEGTT